jgi:CII-binding regulator of phage lambda lysogenization HflD
MSRSPLCLYHGNHCDPDVGLAYLTREDARLMSMAREHDWTHDCLDELIEKVKAVRSDPRELVEKSKNELKRMAGLYREAVTQSV